MPVGGSSVPPPEQGRNGERGELVPPMVELSINLVHRARWPPRHADQRPARAHSCSPAVCRPPPRPSWLLLPAASLSRACSARLAASHRNNGAAHDGLAHHARHRLSMAGGGACCLLAIGEASDHRCGCGRHRAPPQEKEIKLIMVSINYSSNKL